MTLAELRAAHDGSFPAYAWPGGYPVIYVARDGAVFCAKCANGENGSDAHVGGADDDWRIDGWAIHWEGQPEVCCHCNAEIESAYGPVEGE